MKLFPKSIITLFLTIILIAVSLPVSTNAGGGIELPPMPFNPGSQTVAVTGVSLNKTAETVYTADGSVTLIAHILPENATNKSVSWTSSDESVATVSDGVVTLLKHGTATITVKSADGGKTASCALTVLCSHPETDEVGALASTCITAGHGAYVSCKICGAIISGSSEPLPLAAHTAGTAVTENAVEATEDAPGGYDTVTYCTVCKAEMSRVHTDIPALGPAFTEESYFEGEVKITVPRGALPAGTALSVEKIVETPAEIAASVAGQSNGTPSLTYYQVKLTGEGGEALYTLNEAITIKTLLPELPLGKRIRIFQVNAAGEAVLMESWIEDGYLCCKTDWLEK